MIRGTEALRASKYFWESVRDLSLSEHWLAQDMYLGASLEIDGKGIPTSKLAKFKRDLPMEERPLLYHDATVFGSGKKGFLVSDRKIYFTEYAIFGDRLWMGLEDAQVVVDRGEGSIYIGDTRVETGSLSPSNLLILHLYFGFLKDPKRRALRASLLKALQPWRCSSLLSDLQSCGVDDDALASMAEYLPEEDNLICSAGELFFTKRWIVSRRGVAVRRLRGTMLYFEEMGDGGAGHRAGVEVARNPSLFNIAKAAIKIISLESAPRKYRVLAKSSDKETELQSGIFGDTLGELKDAAKRARVVLSAR